MSLSQPTPVMAHTLPSGIRLAHRPVQVIFCAGPAIAHAALAGATAMMAVVGVEAANPTSGNAGVVANVTAVRVAALTAALLAVGVTVLLWRRSSVSQGPPRVSRLFVHPVKSCAPIEVSSLRIDALGFENDRRWAVIDEKKNPGQRILTLRSHPRLALVVPELPEDGASRLVLRAPGMPVLQVPPVSVGGRTVQVDLWGIDGSALDCGDATAKWFQDFLAEDGLRLAYLGTAVEASERIRLREPCKQAAWNGGSEASSVYFPGSRVGFADNSQGTILSESSLVDLNRRLPWGTPPLMAERFRMNIMVSGTQPYEEEMWKEFRIGDIDFVVSRLDNRCTVTLVDHLTGKSDSTDQLLQVLRKYRTKEKLWRVDPRHRGPILGTKFGTAVHAGIIHIGTVISNVTLRTSNDRMY